MKRGFLSFLVIAFLALQTAFTQNQALPLAADGTLRMPVSVGFSIQYRQGFKILNVRSPWPGSQKSYSYVLYPSGTAKPAGIKADGFFQTPVKTVVSYSSTYVAMIEALGELDSLRGVDNKDYIYSPAVRKLVSEGKIGETTKNWMPDIERMIALKPDAIFNFGVGNEWDTHPKMQEAGLPVIIAGDWNEADPLARAAWLVFFAAFYDKEAAGLKRLAQIKGEYDKLAKLARDSKGRPAVLVNGPFGGSWSVSGGSSYMARLLADAGANYLWADSKGTGGLTLSLEAVFAKAMNADCWVNPGAVTSLSGLVASDPRFAAIPAVSNGNVWNNDRRVSPTGGNDYFESAVIRPQAVLEDLIAIFHPELLPGHEFVYYRKLGN